MAKSRHPHRGSMQFWPRKRSKHNLARVRSWANSNDVKPLGFIGYKAGMTHVMASDNRPKSLTKGEKISLPTTIVECPPMVLVGAVFYVKSLLSMRKSATIFSSNLPKELSRKISVPKKNEKKLDSVSEFDDVKLLVMSSPKDASGTKKPKLLEIALGGNKDDKLTYVKEHFGKAISINDIFDPGVLVDIHGITKGKGFQGTVKRYGVPIRQHKSEKVKRGIGNLGAWTPKRVDFRVPQTGKMGFHLRTEYNKQVLKVGENGEDVTPKGGITKYGLVNGAYILLKGSISGPRKRAVVLTAAIRPNKKMIKDSYKVSTIIR